MRWLWVLGGGGAAALVLYVVTRWARARPEPPVTDEWLRNRFYDRSGDHKW